MDVDNSIYWLFECAGSLDESPEAFLNAAELEKYSRFRFEKRRADWLLGRWTAKRLLQSVLTQLTGETLTRRDFEIYNDADGVPHVRARDTLRLSLSHSAGCAFCACIVDDDSQGGMLLGADIEAIEPREVNIVRDYFTPNEQGRVTTSSPSQHDTIVTAIWSAKEAALKAIKKGLSIDTLAVEVTLAPCQFPPRAWTPFEIHFDKTEAARPPLHGWWRAQDNFVLTLATNREVRVSESGEQSSPDSDTL